MKTDKMKLLVETVQLIVHYRTMQREYHTAEVFVMRTRFNFGVDWNWKDKTIGDVYVDPKLGIVPTISETKWNHQISYETALSYIRQHSLPSDLEGFPTAESTLKQINSMEKQLGYSLDLTVADIESFDGSVDDFFDGLTPRQYQSSWCG